MRSRLRNQNGMARLTLVSLVLGVGIFIAMSFATLLSVPKKVDNFHGRTRYTIEPTPKSLRTYAPNSSLTTINPALALRLRKVAQDSLTKGDLGNAIEAAQILYTDSKHYSGVTLAALSAARPYLTFLDGAVESKVPNQISVDNSVSSSVVFAAKSLSGTCFFAKLSSNGSPQYNSSTSNCAANHAPSRAWSSYWPATQ